MFARTLIAISTAIVVATPALARFEQEVEFRHDTASFFTANLAVSDASACGQMIDVLDGYKSFLGQDTYPEDENSLLTILTGISPEHIYSTPLPVVACN